jgi:hypothetical protein
VSKYNYMSANRSWKSLIIIKFGTSAKYIKLTESEHTYRLDLLEDQTWDSLWNCVVLVSDTRQS